CHHRLLSFSLYLPTPPISTPFPYTTLFRSRFEMKHRHEKFHPVGQQHRQPHRRESDRRRAPREPRGQRIPFQQSDREHEKPEARSEEHTSELQSRFDLVCRLLLEKKKRTAE